MGLKLANKLKQPNFEYDSEEVRYSHRFSPFAGIATPPVVPYSQYKVHVVNFVYNNIEEVTDSHRSSRIFYFFFSYFYIQ